MVRGRHDSASGNSLHPVHLRPGLVVKGGLGTVVAQLSCLFELRVVIEKERFAGRVGRGGRCGRARAGARHVRDTGRKDGSGSHGADLSVRGRGAVTRTPPLDRERLARTATGGHLRNAQFAVRGRDGRCLT